MSPAAVDLRMARYETPGQVALLFIGAALVSVAVIFVLRIEAQKRSEKITTSESMEIILTEVEPTADEDNSVNAVNTQTAQEIKKEKFNVFESLARLKHNIRLFLHLDSTSVRGKRSIDDDHKAARNTIEHSTADEEKLGIESNSVLSEQLLSEALDGHKIRDLRDKIKKLSEAEQIVKAILERFCRPRLEELALSAESRCGEEKGNLSADLEAEYEERLKDFILEYDESHQENVRRKIETAVEAARRQLLQQLRNDENKVAEESSSSNNNSAVTPPFPRLMSHLDTYEENNLDNSHTASSCRSLSRPTS